MTHATADQGAPLSASLLHVYLFGEFGTMLDGKSLSPPPYRAQVLLAALLLRPHLRLRAQLAGLLFPNMLEHQGRRRLSHLLWQLRQWMPQLPVEATPQTLQLSLASIWVDVRAFDRAAHSDDLENWLNALTLYRGDLLAGVYDDWLLERREALYLRYVDLSHRACDALWQQGRLAELLPLAERLAQREPFDERALRTLMRTYQALGRRGAALAAYERYVPLASDELGVDPEPATQALVQAIQTTLYTTGAVAAPVVEASSVTGLLRQAREALVRGEVTRVQGALEYLCTCRQAHASSDVVQDDLRLLEIDLALFLESYDRAADLLTREGSCPLQLIPRERLRFARLALGLRDLISARALASEVLMAAREIGDETMELGALLVLIEVQQRFGQNLHAARTAERGLVLARESGLHYGIARVMNLQGTSHLFQGRYEQAKVHFLEARSVALEHGLRYDLAASLRGLRVVYTYTHVLGKALDLAQEELSLWRDMGLERLEAVALEGVALIQNYLGRSADSLRTIAQAQVVSRRLRDPIRLAINRYNLASGKLYHDDGLAAQAVDDAKQALNTFHAHKCRDWEAATLTILGYALWVDGQSGAALDHLRRAQALSERLGELTFVPELLAYQGLACLALARSTEALALTRQAVMSMAQGDVSDEVVPEICYAHAMALAVNGCNRRAQAYFTEAYEYLLDGASVLPDEEARQAYFHRNPTLRRLMRELHARGIAPSPGADVRSVRLPAIRGGKPLHVRWTLDAGPADVALKRAKGAIALRRTRLSRLLREAQQQGAAPTVADLAQALGVSKRTIQRDRAALRQKV